MRLNILVLYFSFLLVFVTSTTVKPINGSSDHPNVAIADGVPAKAGEFPYLAHFYATSALGSVGLCGGTLIGPYHVLTAAHCIATIGSPLFLNTLSLNGTRPGSLTRTVKKYIKHEKHSFANITNDIAIIVLNSPVTTIPHAKLPTQSTSYVNKTAVVAGWGDTPENPNELSPVLLKTTVTIKDKKICSASYTSIRKPYIDSVMFCAGSANGDACTGDSGGPILMNGVQIGVISNGIACGSAKPGIYTRLTSFLTWIASTRAKNPK